MPNRCSDLPGRGDPLRIRMALVQLRLLGVGAVAGRDDQATPSARAAAVHAVEGARDVRPHRLALPVGERTGVAAARRLERSAFAERRDDLRHGDRLDGHRIAPHAAPCRAPPPSRATARARRRPETSRRPAAGVRRSRGRSRPPRRAPAPGTAALLRWYGFGRPSIVAGSNRRSRSSFIDRAADSAARSAARCARPLPARALPKREQHRGTEHQHEQRAQRDDQGLPALGLRSFRSRRAHPCRSATLRGEVRSISTPELRMPDLFGPELPRPPPPAPRSGLPEAVPDRPGC